MIALTNETKRSSVWYSTRNSTGERPRNQTLGEPSFPLATVLHPVAPPLRYLPSKDPLPPAL